MMRPEGRGLDISEHADLGFGRGKKSALRYKKGRRGGGQKKRSMFILSNRKLQRYRHTCCKLEGNRVFTTAALLRIRTRTPPPFPHAHAWHQLPPLLSPPQFLHKVVPPPPLSMLALVLIGGTVRTPHIGTSAHTHTHANSHR